MTSTAMPSREFHLFSRLPPELRRAIWKDCLPNRVVEWEPPYIFSQTWPEMMFDEINISKPNSRPPILTEVCWESRQVAFENGGFFTGHLTMKEADPNDEDPRNSDSEAQLDT